MILIYLPRPINSHNTIMRKAQLAVVFLSSIFPKTLKMHSQVKSLLTESLYLLTFRLFDIFISNNTHRLLVSASTTSCRYRAQNNGRPERSKSVQNEELTGLTSNVAFVLDGQCFENTWKIWNIYTDHSPVKAGFHFSKFGRVNRYGRML